MIRKLAVISVLSAADNYADANRSHRDADAYAARYRKQRHRKDKGNDAPPWRVPLCTLLFILHENRGLAEALVKELLAVRSRNNNYFVSLVSQVVSYMQMCES